jgi:uroporphyrinogen-III synthase
MTNSSPIGRSGGLAGLRIVSFESRRAQDMAILLRRHGGEVLYAPSMRELPLADERGILEFGARLFDGVCDALILLTGVGTTILVDALSTRWPRALVLERLGRTPLLCRGRKTVAVLERLGLAPTLVASESNGVQELLAALDKGFDVKDKRVFVQEYGAIHAALLHGLRERGAHVTPVKVYRWALPEDTRDLRAALQGIAHRKVDAAIFTSAHQVDNVLEYAAKLSLAPALLESFQRSVLVASIGPVTTEALKRHDITADLSPDQPKMGPLVQALSQSAVRLQRAKRGLRL